MTMRILCFGRFYDEIPGGMQRHVEHLFRSLRGKVEFVHLVPSRDRHSSESRLEGFPVIRKASLNVDGSVAISPALILEARRLHREQPFDLIHLHFPDPMTHLASLALPAGIPRVVSWHADIVKYPRLLKAYRPLLRRALDTASSVVVATPCHIGGSPELSRFATSVGHQQRLRVIPYGFDLEPFLAEHRAADAIRSRFPGRRLFALGRHVYYKGFDRLIRAMPRLPDDVQLIIGGTGPLTASWRALALELGLADRIHFVGLIPDDELPAWYQACDLFCLPAVCEAEAFGIVQVEAMAAGKPVVSTSLNSGVGFVNQHGVTGLLAAPNDVDALAAALGQLLADDTLRAEMGARARQRAIQEFSLQAMGGRMLEVYQDALAGSATRHAYAHAQPRPSWR